MLWTVLTTREHPPENLEAFRRMKAEKAGFLYERDAMLDGYDHPDHVYSLVAPADP